MYWTYKLVSEAYYWNTHFVASVTEPDSTCSLYDLHFTSNIKDSGVSMEILNASTSLHKLATKHKTRRIIRMFILNTYWLFLIFLVVEVLHKTA